MSNCLVTKLKASVDDDSLYKLGETRYELLHEGDGFMISQGGALKVLQGELYYKDISTILTKDSEPQSIPNWTQLKAKTDNTIISISNKYTITFLQSTEKSGLNAPFRFKVLDSSFLDYHLLITEIYKEAIIYLDNKPFGYAPNLTKLGYPTSPLKLYGLSFENFDVKHLPKLTTVCTASSEAMRIENFASHTGLTYMSYRMNTLMQGDLMDFMNKWKSLGVRNKEMHFDTSMSTTANGVNTGYDEEWYGTIDSEGNITLEKR